MKHDTHRDSTAKRVKRRIAALDAIFKRNSSLSMVRYLQLHEAIEREELVPHPAAPTRFRYAIAMMYAALEGWSFDVDRRAWERKGAGGSYGSFEVLYVKDQRGVPMLADYATDRYFAAELDRAKLKLAYDAMITHDGRR